jgi:hypothetical protein
VEAEAEDRARVGVRDGRDDAGTKIGAVSLQHSRRPPRNRVTWPRPDRLEDKSALVGPVEAKGTVPARAARNRAVREKEEEDDVPAGVAREGGRLLRPDQRRPRSNASSHPGAIPRTRDDRRTGAISGSVRIYAGIRRKSKAQKIWRGVNIRSRPTANPTSHLPMALGLISSR